MNILEQLDHPDEIGVSEYRGIYEVLESVVESGDELDLEMAYGICDEFISWAQETKRVLTIAHRDHERESYADRHRGFGSNVKPVRQR